MLQLDTKYGQVPKDALSRILARLKPTLERMQKVAQEGGYLDDYSSINLPFDAKALQEAQKLAKKYIGVDAIVIIGIGGSNLGTIAVQEGIQGKLWNSQEWRPKVFYADTVDPKNIGDIISVVESLFLKGKNVLVNIVTKSGTTTETIANAQLFIRLLSTHEKDPREWLVVTTDRDSPLWQWAQQYGIRVLEIPQKVAGRYSVLSAVGLFPLAVAGIDCAELLAGAREARELCLKDESPAAMSAAHLYFHKNHGKRMHDTFIFSTDLEALGKWCRQLMAESLGKRKSLLRKVVHAGMTPTVSIGTTDLHSMAQLYLGGPQDKFTTFVTVQNEKKDIVLPEIKGFDSLVQCIQGKKLGELRSAIFQGVANTYKKNKLPFIQVTMPERNEKIIGAFLQIKMIETMLLGSLWNVNAFDQPEVEKYKAETRNILVSVVSRNYFPSVK